jgi:hypothetical protein
MANLKARGQPRRNACGLGMARLREHAALWQGSPRNRIYFTARIRRLLP